MQLTSNAVRKLSCVVGALSLALLGGVPAAAEPSHGLSTFGDLKYPAAFTHFDYVNPAAPRGGRMVLFGGFTFDSFNNFIVKGDAASGLDLLFDSLMTRAADEPDALYGLIAKSVDIAPDKKSMIFQLRAEAKFSDGSPVTADDVVATLALLKEKGDPSYRLTLSEVEKAEALAPDKVRFTLAVPGRDLPKIIAGLPVLSKAYYKAHDFEQTTLEPPLGSGPYRIADFKQGTQVTFKRRDDYWAKDLPVNRGRYNFDELKFDYYREVGIALEALKSGNIDVREELTAKDWATAYDVPPVKDGRIQRLTLPDENPSGAQGWFINLRRAKFADPRLRKALDYAFDFDWTNNNVFYGLYTRTESFFENSEMKAKGPPTPEEVALLEPFRNDLPSEVFGEAYRPPHSDGSGFDRSLLKEANRLFAEAGWTVVDGRRVNAKGETLSIEFLNDDERFDRVVLPFIKNLKQLGVDATVRRVDSSQYQRRLKSYDFDIVTQRYILSLTPGVELRNYFSTASAGMEGSLNLSGIKSPAIDALIEKVNQAGSRKDLDIAARALDRVLRGGHYWVPHWFKASHNVAAWNKFSRPEKPPRYDTGIADTWWYDAAKAAKLTPR